MQPLRRTVLALGLLALGMDTVHADAQALRVCVLEHNAPYALRAGTEPSGFDVETARAVAGALGRPLEFVWTNNDPAIHEIDDSDFPTRKLSRSQCDAIFSVPGPAGDSLGQAKSLTLGAPYYGAAFHLVSCGGDVAPQLRALRGHTVAIQSQTVAHFALLTVKAQPRNYFDLKSAIDGVRTNDAEAGLLWGPTTGWQLQQAGKGEKACAFVPGYEPPQALRWNQHVATRKTDEALRADVDRALATLNTSGELGRIAARYGMPLHAPFSSTYSLQAVNALSHLGQNQNETQTQNPSAGQTGP